MPLLLFCVRCFFVSRCAVLTILLCGDCLCASSVSQFVPGGRERLLVVVVSANAESFSTGLRWVPISSLVVASFLLVWWDELVAVHADITGFVSFRAPSDGTGGRVDFVIGGTPLECLGNPARYQDVYLHVASSMSTTIVYFCGIVVHWSNSCCKM